MPYHHHCPPRPSWGPLLFLVVAFCTITLNLPIVAAADDNNDHDNDNDAGIDIYYINLQRRPDRDTNIQQEFQRVGLLSHPEKYRIHRFNAIDGLSHALTEEEKSWFTRFDANPEIDHHNTNLLKANSLSHMGVWRRFFAESTAKAAIVFQDDVQLHSDFLQHIPSILRHNPPDAVITWIGCNGYASGQVSRSAPLDLNSYNPDQVSVAIPPDNIIGKCRQGLIATNSLAYILTRQGAQQLLEYFANPAQGWDHHTDHALVEFLDTRGVSYISRQILATTMDDGILGSDIFVPPDDESKALQKCELLVKQALHMSVVQKLSRNQAIHMMEDISDDDLMKNNIIMSDDNTPSWLQNMQIRCEPMSCYFPDCKSPIITYVYLNFLTTTTTEEEEEEEETCQANGDSTTCSSGDALLKQQEAEDNHHYEFDPSGVRRSKTRKKFLLHVAPPDVTFRAIADSLPAYWILEQWGHQQKWDIQPSGHWPKHAAATPTTPVKDIPAIEVEMDGQWRSAKIIAVGYRDDSFPPDVYATYVVQLAKDPTKFIPIVDENRIRDKKKKQKRDNKKKKKKKETEL